MIDFFKTSEELLSEWEIKWESGDKKLFHNKHAYFLGRMEAQYDMLLFFAQTGILCADPKNYKNHETTI